MHVSTVALNRILFTLEYQYFHILVIYHCLTGVVVAFSFAGIKKKILMPHSQFDSDCNLIAARVSIKVKFQLAHIGGIVSALCKVL